MMWVATVMGGEEETRMNEEPVLYVNGNIFTMDRDTPRVEALLVRDGRIAALGPRDLVEVRAEGYVRRVDLEGRTVVPGFNDCHCHILSFGLNLEQVDVGADTVRTIADIKHALGQRAQRSAEGEWVLGRGYDQNGLEERRHPTRRDLDEVSTRHPIVVWHTSGHALTCNSRALELAGLTAATETPSGGDIERDEHGEPTGVFKESPAMNLLSSQVPPPTLPQGAEAIVRAMDVMASQGITSASDAATGHGPSITDEVQMYRSAARSGKLAGRIVLMPQIEYVAPPNSDDAHLVSEFLVGDDPEWLQIGATKIFADGALTTRTAALREPYADGDSNSGLLIWDQETLCSMIRRASAAGWQIGTHAIGDRAIEVVLECYEQALRETPRQDHRHRIEHCMLLDRELGRRIQQMGIVPTIQPGFISRLGDAYVAALGMERASQLMPMQLFDWMGITVGFSSDRPVIPGAPLRGVRSAMQRVTPQGIQLGPEHTMTALEAVRHYTSGSAYATHTEDWKGTLRRGSVADFTVLSRNPAETNFEDFGAIRVLITVAGGTETFRE